MRTAVAHAHRASDASEPLLAIEGLTIEIASAQIRHCVVESLDLRVLKGEVMALVGESGSGKSLTARAIMGLLPSGTRVARGRIRCSGQELTALSARDMDRIRGRRIGMLFQQPQVMLDPTARVGAHVSEALRKHRGLSQFDAQQRTLELLAEVGVADPERRARAYAFELSGGLAQRVMIAAALSADPDLLIADEPTTSLDVTVQAQILRLIDEQRRKRQMGVLLISHDLAMVSAIASRVAVMYAGRIVEEGPADLVLRAPRHPYTRALVACSLLDPVTDAKFATIAGSVASAQILRTGCRFHPRCDLAAQSGHYVACQTHEPDLIDHADGVQCRCWHHGRPEQSGRA
jgi:peptide/nickel transport system ATP-binding protein